MKIESYRDLEAYKKGYSLVILIYHVTKNFPPQELYGITSQIRRAVVSIPSNIAEGFVRGSKEYIQFLKIALGSSTETETLLALSRDLNFLSSADFDKAYNLNTEVIQLLRHYIKRLSL